MCDIDECEKSDKCARFLGGEKATWLLNNPEKNCVGSDHALFWEKNKKVKR